MFQWKPVPQQTVDYAEEMGYDSVVNGANTTNCHFSLFASKELTTAWEKGARLAKQDLAHPTPPKDDE